jgi:LPXTG-motif cell wall-anchored protein
MAGILAGAAVLTGGLLLIFRRRKEKDPEDSK